MTTDRFALSIGSRRYKECSADVCAWQPGTLCHKKKDRHGLVAASQHRISDKTENFVSFSSLLFSLLANNAHRMRLLTIKLWHFGVLRRRRLGASRGLARICAEILSGVVVQFHSKLIKASHCGLHLA